MRTTIILASATCFLLSAITYAEISLNSGTTAHFASMAEGRTLLGAKDEFVERMSPFDRSARLKTDKPVSEAEYLAFVEKNVLDWTDDEKQMLGKLLQEIADPLRSLLVHLPAKILLVKTTGAEEGQAAYTRGNAVVLPVQRLRTLPPDRIKSDICHEIFHILSRSNPEVRDRLYQVIGFKKCEEIDFPPELKSRKITNPDAPKNDHYIQIEVDGEKRFAIPILFSRSETYDSAKGGEFFHYLRFQFLLVEVEEGSTPRRVTALKDSPGPKLVDVMQTSGFVEQIGSNTRYIIHPEEILADNFAHLIIGKTDLPSPEIVAGIKEVLSR